MRIQIFDNAKLDLVDGYSFYEMQESGVGQYFLDSLYSDIDSLALYAGVHPKKSEYSTGRCRSVFRMPSITPWAPQVSVHAVLDCRQDPKRIEERLLQERTRRWSQ